MVLALVYALGYLWRRSGGRMALWSTDVLRPPKFDAALDRQPETGAKLAAAAACEIIGRASKKTSGYLPPRERRQLYI